MIRILAKLAILVFLILVASPICSLLQACPGCKEALPGEVSHGFNASVLFMMAMPFFVVGSIAAGIVIVTRSRRENPRENLKKDTSEVREENER